MSLSAFKHNQAIQCPLVCEVGSQPVFLKSKGAGFGGRHAGPRNQDWEGCQNCASFSRGDSVEKRQVRADPPTTFEIMAAR